MRVRTTNWDALAAARPNDVTAARVTARAGEPYIPTLKVPEGYFHSATPPGMTPLEALNGGAAELAAEWVGQRVGTFTVVGLQHDPQRAEKGRWVVRCDCSAFERRTVKALKQIAAGETNQSGDTCIACQHRRNVLRIYDEKGGHTIDYFADREAREQDAYEPFRLHLSGPMSGHPDENRAAFNRVAGTLRSLDYRVFNPAEIPREAEYGAALQRNLTFICHRAQGQLRLSGWKSSPGALAEAAAARAMELPWWEDRDGRFVPGNPQAMTITAQDLVGNAGDVRRLYRRYAD